MPITAPTRIYRNRCGIFCFRLKLPKALHRPGLPTEARLSLRTAERREALALARWLNLVVPSLLNELGHPMSEEDHKDSKDNRLLTMLEGKLREMKLVERVEQLEAEKDDQRIEHLRELKAQKTKAAQVVEKAYLKGYVKATEQAAVVAPALVKKKSGPLLSEAQNAYLKHLASRPQDKRPTEKTLDEYRSALDLFIAIVSNRPVSEIDRDVMADFFGTLCRLPANMNRRPRYIGKSVPELLALGDPPMSETNASKITERVSTLFKWMLDEKAKFGIDTNPAKGYGRGKPKKSSRKPFTDAELVALLSHPTYRSRTFGMSYTYWAIPLALFTGARLGELGQLYLSDFVQVDGIDCIEISDEQPGQRLKTDNAKRLVPVHSALIRLGLLRYVAKLRERGEKVLFPELNFERRDGPGQAVGHWFQRYRPECGITGKQEKVFHSFRHTFITRLLDPPANTPPHLLAPIVGHEADLITGQVYWGKGDASKRRETIEAFKLPDAVLKLIPKVEDITITRAPKGRRV